MSEPPGTFQIWNPETYDAHLAEEEEEDLGFDIPEGTNPLDALDMALARQAQDGEGG